MPFMSISSEFSLARSFALLAVLKRVEAFVLRHVDDANFPDVVEPNWSTKQDLGEHDVSIEDSARLATDSEDEPRRNIIVVSVLCYSVVKMGILYPIAVNFRFFVPNRGFSLKVFFLVTSSLWPLEEKRIHSFSFAHY